MDDEEKCIDLEKLYQIIADIIGEREGVKIKFKIERKEDNGIPMQVRLPRV